MFNSLFILLLLLSIGCLIVGLIKPNIFQKVFKREMTRKKILLIFGIASVVLFILVGITSPASTPVEKSVTETKENKEQVETKTEPKESVKPTPQPVVEKPAPQPKQPSTIDQLWIALDQSIGKRDGYDIKYGATVKNANIIYTSTNFYDESAIVRGAYTALVKYGLKAFAIDGVDSITVNYKTELTDTYGKKSIEDVVILMMSKQEFSKYDWNSLKYQPVYRQMEASCSKYYIHPAILKNLDYSKLYLSL